MNLATSWAHFILFFTRCVLDL